MLEYFTYKKFKKNKAEKEQKKEGHDAVIAGKQPEHETKVISSPPAPATPAAVSSSSPSKAEDGPSPLLTDDDERFLERLTTLATDDDEDGPAPPLPPRVSTPELSWDSDSESFVKPAPKPTSTSTLPESSTSATAGKKSNRLSALFTRSKKNEQQLVAPTNLAVPDSEADREKADLSRVLDDLNLSARNNTAFSLSADSTELVRRFTLILKDLVNGVPTAVNDLTTLLDDPDGKLAKNYEKLPKSLKKLVTQLPEKLSKSLAPELLAVAAEAQGLGKADAGSKEGDGGLKGAAKRLFLPKNLAEMVTKPGAIVGMLRGIMNALKMRWPAFIGTNVLWSVALFLLLFVLWYCHKRGREVRLEKEDAANAVDGSDRIEELPDDPALPAPPEASRNNPTIVEPESESATPAGKGKGKSK
ncbi:hypothetical protein GE09DRAFT_1214054 [Coniochaeta sp. 2T2.1]|nr:hypothetical protein GE09DRAFT_1214054 [Coniochaeta sp. 2T2.1]